MFFGVIAENPEKSVGSLSYVIEKKIDLAVCYETGLFSASRRCLWPRSSIRIRTASESEKTASLDTIAAAAVADVATAVLPVRPSVVCATDQRRQCSYSFCFLVVRPGPEKEEKMLPPPLVF